jgi:sugar lactone lactonase YvrE
MTFVPPLIAADELFVAKPFTAEHSFTGEIEGPACDRAGNIYAVSFARKPTIGKVTPDGKGEIFIEFTNGSLANGIRFDRSGIMYAADYTNHNILRIDPKTRAVTVLAHSDEMNQPNDLAITAQGMLFASDPNWDKGTGQLWRVDRGGALTRIATDMGTTNGIEVSPDGKKLYVNETVQRKVWAFTLKPDGSISEKTLLIEFPDHGLDGMRCDVDGNLYITRFGKGTVVKISPKGDVLREIDALGAKPTNVCFGGPDGRTCYVTEVEHGRLVQFRVDRPGLEWQINRSGR